MIFRIVDYFVFNSARLTFTVIDRHNFHYSNLKSLIKCQISCNAVYVIECVVILNLKAMKCYITHLNEFIWISFTPKWDFTFWFKNKNTRRFTMHRSNVFLVVV